MRILVYALVLANLGFWAWRAWFAPPPPEPARYDGPGLTLLSEFVLPAAEEIEVPPEPEPEPVLVCVAMGPFDEPETAEAARTLLADLGIDARPAPVTTDVREGYWVYVERLADMAAAREALADIEDLGIEDAYIIQNSDSGILISLGIYSDLVRASTLANRVGDRGMSVTVTERTQTTEVVWLEFDQVADDPTAAGLLREQFGDALEQTRCTATL